MSLQLLHIQPWLVFPMLDLLWVWQQQQQAQQAMEMATQAAQGAKTLSETEVTDDNLLRRMTGQ